MFDIRFVYGLAQYNIKNGASAFFEWGAHPINVASNVDTRCIDVPVLVRDLGSGAFAHADDGSNFCGEECHCTVRLTV